MRLVFLGENRMVMGEKIWEGKSKTMNMTVKGVNAEGVMFEFTWMAQLKGSGKAIGLDGSVLFTANVTVSQAGIATFAGSRVFSTLTGDQATIKGSGSGTGQGDQGKGISIWSFMTLSLKLSWMN
jgi:hypothetical protein